jgi:hypothetical protein
MCELVPFELNNRLADTEGTVHGAVVETEVTSHTQKRYRTKSNKNLAASLFVHSLQFSVFRLFTSITPRIRISTEDNHTFA